MRLSVGIVLLFATVSKTTLICVLLILLIQAPSCQGTSTLHPPLAGVFFFRPCTSGNYWHQEGTLHRQWKTSRFISGTWAANKVQLYDWYRHHHWSYFYQFSYVFISNYEMGDRHGMLQGNVPETFIWPCYSFNACFIQGGLSTGSWQDLWGGISTP